MPRQTGRLSPPEAESSPQSRLLRLFEARHLSPSHSRIARYLVERAPDSVFLSSIALAAEVGVSQPSVSRFARALGFAGYTDLQAELRGLMVDRGASGQGEAANDYQQAVRESIHNLEALESFLADADQIAALGRQLARSDPLVVLSVRASAPAASYFAYYAARVHSDVRLLTAGGSALLDGLSQARRDRGQWILCFLLSRHPVEMLTALRFARDLDFRVATVADRPTASVRELSDVVLPAAVGTRGLFTTYAAPMVLAGVLLEALCQAAPRRTRERIEQHERMLFEQRVFLAEGSTREPRR